MKSLVSIVCITYNHEPYLRKALDGFLMQETNFPYEIILAEDCSTDGTRQICEEYKAKYPDRITYISRDYNVGGVGNERRAIAAARGKYLAFCEGDDYWIDPLKLQKQVDFMESHPDYSVCFTRYNKSFKSTGKGSRGAADALFIGKEDADYITLSMDTAMNLWCTQYLTLLCRRDCYDNTWYKRYKYFRDTHQVYHLMCQGKCAILNFVGGVYCITGNGEHSSKDYFFQEQMTLAVDTELWKVNKDDRWKSLCRRVMQDMIDRGCDGDRRVTIGDRMVMMKYAWRLLWMTGGIGKFFKNIDKIIRL
ncbi:MAG: glycosyltransferase family 2 protein [Prevotellaceae bacterium]|nr:glycosyltransferase family 2 protein [Candidatus Colivivens equi]